MAITIGRNIASLQAQRRLGESTQKLATTYERLSSGQRINRASDDAAGLAIATTLNSNARVFSQANRNLNDGISLLNVADGAVNELTNIVIRIQELAEQAANGTYTSKQRSVLDAEAQALSDEYFRIVKSTEFNGMKLFDGTNGDIALQAGYGANAILGASTGGRMGNGVLGPKNEVPGGGSVTDATLGDLNSDGILDMVIAHNSDYGSILIGNGDGSFSSEAVFTTDLDSRSVALGDLNGDGVLDIVTANGNGSASVLIGNGDGTFKARHDFTTPGSDSLALGDLNADGRLDIVTGDAVFLGNGDGSFQANSYLGPSIGGSVALGDFNADGILDIASISLFGGASVLLGNGNGTFKAKTDFTTGLSPQEVTLGDINSDGALDIVTTNNSGSASVLLGNGNGTFKGSIDVATAPTFNSMALGDLNSDGNLDMFGLGNSQDIAFVLIGNGDGSFKPRNDYATGDSPFTAILGDLNGDGNLDAVVMHYNEYNNYVMLGQTRTGVAPLLDFSLKTKTDAKWALELMKQKLSQLGTQRATIGANQSRIGVAVNNLQSMTDAFKTAASRIMDADIAQEAASLVRTQILQHAASAVLAQANQQPALALRLLS